MDYEAKINFCSIFTLIQCLAASRSTKDMNSQWLSPLSESSHAFIGWDCLQWSPITHIWCLLNRGALTSPGTSFGSCQQWRDQPLPSLLSAGLRETSPARHRRSQTNHPVTATTLQLPGASCFSGQLKKQGREKEKGTETDRQLRRGETKKCCVPEAFISPNEMETAEGKHCFAFLKIVFPVEWVEKKISFPFPAILRDLFAKSAGLVGETRSIYFLYMLVIYEAAINAEFMEVKSGHEIKRILFKYPSLLILSNSSQRRRWVRMHTRFTEY